MTEIQTGYTTQDVKTLTPAQLLKEALQSGYDAGYYAHDFEVDDQRRHLSAIARARRDDCFAELTRRLADAERLAEALKNISNVKNSVGQTPPSVLIAGMIEMAKQALAVWAGGQEEKHDRIVSTG